MDIKQACVCFMVMLGCSLVFALVVLIGIDADLNAVAVVASAPGGIVLLYLTRWVWFGISVGAIFLSLWFSSLVGLCISFIVVITFTACAYMLQQEGHSTARPLV